MKKVLKAIIVATLAVALVASCKKTSTSKPKHEESSTPVDSVRLDHQSVTLAEGDTLTLKATVFPEDASDKTLTWISNNEVVATVDENGKVTAVSGGEANITAMSKDDLGASCAVIVTISVTGVNIDTSLVMLAVGDSLTLSATVFPEYASDKAFTWSSDKEEVATVDENGKVTAVAVGEASIIATSKDGGKTDTCAVTVTAEGYVKIGGLKWAKRNLAISESGKAKWKPGGSEIAVPGTAGDKVIIGDYFQWGTYQGYCGNPSDADKGLLVYTAFNCSSYDGSGQSSAFTFKGPYAITFATPYSPYYDERVSDHVETSKYTKYTKGSEGDGKNVLEPSDDVAAIILGGTWRMPTKDDFIAMMEATYWKWDATDKGYYVYTPNPAEDAGRFNEYGKGNSYVKTDALLFFPAAGYGNKGSLDSVGSRGLYWSSTLATDLVSFAARLSFGSGIPDVKSNVDSRCCGFSVRPVTD